MTPLPPVQPTASIATSTSPLGMSFFIVPETPNRPSRAPLECGAGRYGPMVFECFWTRRARVRLGREKWQGAPRARQGAVSASKSGSRAAAAARRGSRARTLRIIGGAWRGRKLRFPASAAIRPTPDRVRETLSHWLGARTQGARAVHLFAGSGALGLEALSRGASHLTFVERDDAAAHELRARLAEWQAPHPRGGRAGA